MDDCNPGSLQGNGDKRCFIPELLSVLPEKNTSEREEIPQPFLVSAHLNGHTGLLLGEIKTLTGKISRIGHVC